jgi:hypothetical protein
MIPLCIYMFNIIFYILKTPLYYGVFVLILLVILSVFGLLLGLLYRLFIKNKPI